jgi:hypothetical protein
MPQRVTPSASSLSENSADARFAPCVGSGGWHRDAGSLRRPARPNNLWRTAVLVIVLWAAFALRVARLDRQPLWWDEGLSIFFAHQNLSSLVSETLTTSDANPPVYRLILSAWQMFAGTSPFATRLLLVKAGVLTVALTWTVGRWLTNRNAAALAALFLAVAPLQIYYAREAKGYAFAALCAIISTYAWGRKLGYLNLSARHGHRVGWWIIYVLSTLAAIGTHYYLGLLVLWQGLWVAVNAGLTFIRKRNSRREVMTHLMQWTCAAVVMALALTPWVLTVFRTTVGQVTGVSRGSALSLWSYLGQVAIEFSVGPGAEGVLTWLGSGMLTLLVVAGAVTNGMPLFLLTGLVVPLAAAFPIQANYSFFSPRFLLFLGPACYLLAGRGIEILRRRISPASVVLAVVSLGLCVPGLDHIYNKPVDEAEDARPLMEQIRAAAQPGDAVLTTYIWQDGYLISYVPDVHLAFYRSSYNKRTVSSLMEEIFGEHERLWVYNYKADIHDTYNPLNAWLNRNTALAFDGFYGNMQLALFVRSNPIPATWPGQTSFERGITLAYTLPSLRGNVINLNLRWQTAAALDRAYKVFVHLRQPAGEPIAQSDSEPAGGFDPTDTWLPGQPVIDRRALLVPPNAPPGTYGVYVGLYDPDSGARLRTSQALDSVLVGHVDIPPREEIK